MYLAFIAEITQTDVMAQERTQHKICIQITDLEIKKVIINHL